ncbi:hypothetical protein [Nannocystis pusilla]|uniref:hypothetical protein n=1 Tax=Nannocystis pusilla TaxID=889268 RepID=UPI003DA6B934
MPVTFEDEAGGRAVADPPEHVVDERRRDLVGDVALQRDDESTPQLNNRCSVLEVCPVVVHHRPTAIVGVRRRASERPHRRIIQSPAI